MADTDDSGTLRAIEEYEWVRLRRYASDSVIDIESLSPSEMLELVYGREFCDWLFHIWERLAVWYAPHGPIFPPSNEPHAEFDRWLSTGERCPIECVDCGASARQSHACAMRPIPKEAPHV